MSKIIIIVLIIESGSYDPIWTPKFPSSYMQLHPLRVH